MSDHAETYQRLREQMKERLQEAGDDFPQVKKQCLDYVDDWPEEERTKARSMIAKEQAARSRRESSDAPRESAHVQAFLKLFGRSWGDMSEDMQDKCRRHFKQGHDEFKRICSQQA